MNNWTMDKVKEYASVYTDYENPWESHEIKIDMMKNKEEENFLSTLTYNEFNEFCQQVINEVFNRIDDHKDEVDYTGYNY